MTRRKASDPKVKRMADLDMDGIMRLVREVRKWVRSWNWEKLRE